MSNKHTEKCEKKHAKTIIRNLDECHPYWKSNFNRNPLYFRFIADFQAHNEVDNANIGKRQLTIIEKTQFLKVFTNYLNWMIFQKVNFMYLFKIY